jgi:hypothetical protein
MIQLEYQYVGIPVLVKSDGDAVAADDGVSGVLYRNGSATAVPVYVEETGVTGLYKARFTTLGTDDGWAKTDRLFLRCVCEIDSVEKDDVVWDSFAEIDAVTRGTDGAYTGTPPSAAAISSQVASDLAAAHGAGSWSTATGFATPTNVSDTETAILAKLPESGRASAVDPDNAGIREAAVNAGIAAREWLD